MSMLPTPTDLIEIIPRSSNFHHESGTLRTPRSSRRASPYPTPSARGTSRRVQAQSRSPSPSLSSASFESLEDERFWAHGSDSEHSSAGSPDASSSGPRIPSSNAASTHGTTLTEESTSHGTKNTGPIKEVRFTQSEDNTKLIPKPNGEVGRPGRGGYTLLNALGWHQDDYRTVKKFINEAVENHLDLEQPMRRQSLSNVKKVRELALNKYPVLEQYMDNWAIDDFIRSYLKCKRVALKKEKLEKLVVELEKSKQTAEAAEDEARKAAAAVGPPRHSRRIQ